MDAPFSALAGAAAKRSDQAVTRAPWLCVLLAGTAAAHASAVLAGDALQWSGFATLRAASHSPAPFDQDPVSAQLQLGLDWTPSSSFLVHVHLLARTDEGDSRRGTAGTPEAYAELNLRPGASRIRLRGGAFFLPTSRENVDALWENPYTVSSSALNTWFGEELRPIGLDATFSRSGALLGATVFRGSETLGALPLAPGWTMHDRWTLLGQKVLSGRGYYASLSSENDGRLGWSARAGWNGARFAMLVTHLDNRSDARPHGDVYNWNTSFDVVSVELDLGDWTMAAEAGWGPTSIDVRGRLITSDLSTAYALVSRRLSRGRVSARLETFSDGKSRKQALTLAGQWTPGRRVGMAVELLATEGTVRALLQVRFSVSGS